MNRTSTSLGDGPRPFLYLCVCLTLPPSSSPSLVLGSTLTFITTVGAFIEIDMVGGGEWQLIGNYVWSQYGFTGGLPQGSASAVFIIVITVLLLNFYRKYSELE